MSDLVKVKIYWPGTLQMDLTISKKSSLYAKAINSTIFDEPCLIENDVTGCKMTLNMSKALIVQVQEEE